MHSLPSLLLLKHESLSLRNNFGYGALTAYLRVRDLLAIQPARLTQAGALLVTARQTRFARLNAYENEFQADTCSPLAME